MDIDTTAVSADDPPEMNPSLCAFMRKLLQDNQALDTTLVPDNAAVLPEDLSFTVNLLRLGSVASSLYDSDTSLPEVSRWDSHVVTSPASERAELSLKLPQRRRSDENLRVSLEDQEMVLALPCLQLVDPHSGQHPEQRQSSTGSNEPCKHVLPLKFQCDVQVRSALLHLLPLILGSNQDPKVGMTWIPRLHWGNALFLLRMAVKSFGGRTILP
jgi:hypothetical protein